MSIKSYVWILLWILTGCATVGEVDNLEYSIGEVKTFTFAFFKNSLQEDGDTGRDYVSTYFRPNLVKGRIESPRSEDKVRARAKVRIIGNERPYSVITRVEVETQDKGQWESQGTDDALSKKVANLLREYIRTRRDKNIIDHFKPF